MKKITKFIVMILVIATMLFTVVSCNKKKGELTVKEDAMPQLVHVLGEDLDLSARTANALLNNDIKTVRDLVMLSENDLKDLKGFGTKALDEVKEKLTELNI